MERFIRAELVADFSAEARCGEVAAFCAGPDGTIYLLFHIDRPRAGRTGHSGAVPPERRSWFSAGDYRVVARCSRNLILDLEVLDLPFQIHNVQPHPEGLLLTCGRCRYRGAGDVDLNALVYDFEGRLVKRFLLGDGIEDVQVTSQGEIWTSYFDEGVFGNLGWNEPIGADGLIAWDSEGRRLYGYRPPPDVGWLADCYALNVASDADVWLCYYTDFPLVHLHNREVAGVWKNAGTGGHAFAVGGGRVLFVGHRREHKLYLTRLLENGGSNDEGVFSAVDELGEPLRAQFIIGRGTSLYFYREARVYAINVLDSSLW